MKYQFYILTIDGLHNSKVESNYNFSQAPFGFVAYRDISSCECSNDLIEDFWRCVDLVLENNNTTSEKFIRAVRAYDADGNLHGELENK